MSDNYTAWDGVDYPWPPPEGWVLGSDGRYWPDGQQPSDAPDAAPSIEPIAAATPAVGAPAPGGAPVPGAAQPPGGAPPPGAMPPGTMPPGAGPAPYNYAPAQPAVQQVPGTYTYGSAPAKSSKAGWWILGILLVLMAAGLGGCFLIAGVLRDGATEFSNTLDDFEDDFTRREEAKQAISVSACSVEGGVPTASGTVTNVRSSISSYFVQIEFFETSTGNLIGSADTSILNIEPGNSENWELKAQASGIEGAIQCNRSSESIRIED